MTQRPPRVWLVGVAAAALLLSDAGAAIALSHKGSAGPPPGSLAAAVPALEVFVAHDRGLAYTHRVKVVVMTPAALTAYVDKNDGLDETDAAEAELDQALGLVDDAQAYLAHEKVESSADVDGLYEDGTDTIRIAAEESDAYTRSVVVHELTHALDDQHFDLSRVEDRAFEAAGDIAAGDRTAFDGAPLPDLVTGFDGLLEGDAERVRDDYLAQLSSADSAAESKEETAAGADVPFDDDDETLAPLTFLPYTDGVDYTRALLRAGGQAELDATFADPPTTTRQILHPGVALGTVTQADPATPPGDVVATGSMGEAGLAVVLGEVDDDTGEVVSTLAAAWRSDRVTVSTDGGKACADWALTLAGSSDAIAAQLRARLPEATVATSGSGLTVASCR